DLKVKPAVPSYSLKPNLSNVVNFKQFKPLFTPRAIAMVARNGFVVTPTDYTQMFHVYENNEYQRPRKFQAFITTDSMLHTYHVFYDYSLRTVESTKLFEACVKMTDAMLAASGQDLIAAKPPELKDAARRNVAYFAVARKLLGGAAPPEIVKDLANADLKKIEGHAERDFSDVFGHKVDFSQFVPRGHYTRSEKLKRYFKAMMWYGLTQFAIPQGKIGPRPTRMALLVVRNLRTAKAGNAPVMKLWDMIYEPTVFYVGSADDYTVYDYSRLSDKIYGKKPSVEDFADDARLKTFISEAEKLPASGIENFIAISRSNSNPDPWFPVLRQFRLMGQRFIPDSRTMQELTHPKAKGRNFPKGLDVFAAMGSDRALDILQNTYSVNVFKGFEEQMKKMRSEMEETPRQKWQSNLYYGWVWSLQSITKPTPLGYPTFMHNDAWLDKSLFTALGSWTELRHDTILYAKQSVSECGGDGEEIPIPKGYVEPNLEFWTKLKWLNQYTKEGLVSRGLLTEELKDKFARLGDWIDFCRRITVKELTNQKVTEEEYQQICMYGSELEHLTLDFAGGAILSEADKDMALVADVHTSFENVMEEGTGRAGAIYVVVPIEGKLYMTRGAVYTQYEFEWPAADRLTDEKWQKMLQTNREPGFAEWIKSFFIDTKKKPAPEFENYPEGC
ncbi:MAG: hypothetical protein A2Z18_07265, partial [Armatimonadetes bacterium RBG_16_58_9]